MKKISFFFMTLILALGFNACSDDDNNVSLPDISVDFANTETGMSNDNTTASVTINLSRKADTDLNVTVSMTTEGAVYDTDFTTNPAPEGSNIVLTIPAGTTSASIDVSKKVTSEIDGADYIKFELTAISVTNGFKIGEKASTILYFGPILSTGDQLTLNGKVGDQVYKNSVYVDLSKNSQVVVDRESWNLGFYNGADFRVVLNAADATTALATDKNDITAVTLADAETAYNIGGSFYMTADGLRGDVVDAFDGSLSGTVFAQISANDAENKVYLVAPAKSKANRSDWYKVKVNRKGDGYSVQYAKVGDTTIKTVDVTKDAAYNLSFLSFEKATTTKVEPTSDKWDIMWGYFTGERSSNGIYDGTAYFMQDVFVINNLGGTQAAQVLASDVTYANFGKADLAKVTLSSDRIVIGDKWRSTSNFGGGTLGIYTDRFYVVKDAEGNYYKLRMLKMGLNNDGGERGRPVIEYALIQE